MMIILFVKMGAMHRRFDAMLQDSCRAAAPDPHSPEGMARKKYCVITKIFLCSPRHRPSENLLVAIFDAN